MPRHTPRGRIVIVGFGVTGASAARQLLSDGTDPAEIVAVDLLADPLECATALGIHTQVADATERDTLAWLVSDRTRCVIVTIGPDASAIMTTMHARHLCPTATVLTAISDDEHAGHALRAGADEVITNAQWTGHALAKVLD